MAQTITIEAALYATVQLCIQLICIYIKIISLNLIGLIIFTGQLYAHLVRLVSICGPFRQSDTVSRSIYIYNSSYMHIYIYIMLVNGRNCLVIPRGELTLVHEHAELPGILMLQHPGAARRAACIAGRHRAGSRSRSCCLIRILAGLAGIGWRILGGDLAASCGALAVAITLLCKRSWCQ